jgi:hypothetical protein
MQLGIDNFLEVFLKVLLRVFQGFVVQNQNDLALPLRVEIR